ncbi:MAG TPA: RNA 2',3'-cyclic phosphodiesterase [Acidimicrobiales bacterium]|nr:RNA 2',3'-cyclic phosphodiesterase [Acidimicrobiales bacterium]
MRLFVAVHLPGDVLDLLAGLPRPERPGVRWTTRAQWHVTLRFLGEVDAAAVPAVAAALAAAPLAPATAVLGPQVAALGARVIQVPVAGLDGLAASVVAATAGYGRPPESRAFRGHVTLARVSRGGVRGLVGEPVAASFPVPAVDLVRSRPGRGGAQYETIHARPLA